MRNEIIQEFVPQDQKRLKEWEESEGGLLSFYAPASFNYDHEEEDGRDPKRGRRTIPGCTRSSCCSNDSPRKTSRRRVLASEILLHEGSGRWRLLGRALFAAVCPMWLMG
mmetsp:Transcript_28190/g.65925  ORF Transcript_28190/g.65925 Transcript_28190/m.65925 type:complete len:110 (+) Transcript_28190:44-373(+)